MNATVPVALCDICTNPGQCCRKFTLTRSDGMLTLWDDEPKDEQLRAHGLPFHVVETLSSHVADNGRTYSAHMYGCPLLRAGGRCGDYANRPNVCRTYVAGSDGLCAMYRPPS